MNMHEGALFGGASLSDDITVTEYMRPLRPFLDRDGVTEVCVNRPGEVYVETRAGWEVHAVPELTVEHCASLANAVATLTGQFTNEQVPLLGAQLPTGERVQFVQPSASERGVIGICIRKPSTFLPRLEDFARNGLFSRVRHRNRELPAHADELPAHAKELLALLNQRDYEEFFRKAVRHHQTIVVAGATGSGKTTFMKALVEEIPISERLITIEDAAELTLPNHRNKLHLFYAKNNQGCSAVTAKHLLEVSLRLRPDRILLAEVRGEEAYYFLRSAASGHPGSITSLHAGSCELAFEQLALMVRESVGGGGMTMAEIQRLARSVIDVVVHIEYDRDAPEGLAKRYITGIHYDPVAQLDTGGRERSA